MPKFWYSIYSFTILCFAAVVLILWQVSPSSYLSIFAFLIMMFLFAGFSCSIFIYRILDRKNPKFSQPNILYRKALKSGLYISFGFTGLLFLLAFKLTSLLNIGLFALLYLGIFFQIRDRR